MNLDEDEKLDLFSGFNEMSENPFSVCCSAPTQSLLQKWLREEHYIIVWVYPAIRLNGYQGCIQKKNMVGKNIILTHKFETYEEALEQGLFEALKLIK